MSPVDFGPFTYVDETHVIAATDLEAHLRAVRQETARIVEATRMLSITNAYDDSSPVERLRAQVVRAADAADAEARRLSGLPQRDPARYDVGGILPAASYHGAAVERWCHTCPDVPHRVEHPGQLCPSCEGTEAPL